MRIQRTRPRPALEIRDLELVLAIADAGSTLGAGPRLGLSQSAVSRALLAAEGRVGAALFVRGARGLSPTRAGERLVAGGPALLAQLLELEASARGDAALPPLRIVCECYTAYRWLPTVLDELGRGGSELSVSLAVEHTADPVTALRRGDVDAALLTTSKPRGALRAEPLFGDEIVFLLSRRHPLAAKPALTAADLLHYPLIVSTSVPPAEARWFISQVFSRGERPEFLRFPLTEAIVDAARAGLGVAVMSEWIAGPYVSEPDLLLKPFKKKRLTRPWSIAFRPEHADSSLRLSSALRAAVPHLPRAALLRPANAG